LCYASERQG
jgi:hypothetical protein